MICGRKLLVFSLPFLVLLSCSSVFLSADDWENLTEEQVRAALTECVSRLEATTNEHERLIIELQSEKNLRSEYQALAIDLMNKINERDEQLTQRDDRLKETEISFENYVKTGRRKTIRNIVLSISIGVAIGAVITR